MKLLLHNPSWVHSVYEVAPIVDQHYFHQFDNVYAQEQWVLNQKVINNPVFHIEHFYHFSAILNE